MIGSFAKIRVSRVTVNTHFFFCLFSGNIAVQATLNLQKAFDESWLWLLESWISFNLNASSGYNHQNLWFIFLTMMRCTWYNFLTYDEGYLIQLSDLWWGILNTTFWLMMRCTWYNFLTYDKVYLIQLSDIWWGVLDTTFWLMIRGTWYNFLTYDKGYLIQLSDLW